MASGGVGLIVCCCCHHLASKSRSVAPQWPRLTARLQRSAGGRLLSFRIWSTHLLRGRPGRRCHWLLGGRPRDRMTWQLSALWAGTSSGSLATWLKRALWRRLMVSEMDGRPMVEEIVSLQTNWCHLICNNCCNCYCLISMKPLLSSTVTAANMLSVCIWREWHTAQSCRVLMAIWPLKSVNKWRWHEIPCTDVSSGCSWVEISRDRSRADKKIVKQTRLSSLCCRCRQIVSRRTGCESMSALLNLSTQNHVQYVRPDAGGNARSPIITIIMTIYSVLSTYST